MHRNTFSSSQCIKAVRVCTVGFFQLIRRWLFEGVNAHALLFPISIPPPPQTALFGQAFSSTSAERQAVVDALLASGPLNLVRPDGGESNSPVVVNISFYLTRITDLVSLCSNQDYHSEWF